MTRAIDPIYREMCKPSPLSKPPKPELKLLTLGEFEDMVRQRALRDAFERVKVTHREAWRMLAQCDDSRRKR